MFKNIDLFPLFLVLILSISCEESVEWELSPDGNGKLVVEAIFTNERKIQEVKLSQSYDEMNASPPAVTNAIIQASVNGTTIHFFADPNRPGIFQSGRPFRVFPNLNYELNIFWENQIYSANSQLSVVAPIPQFNFTPTVNPGLLRFLAFDDFIYNPNQQAMYEMDIDWSHLSDEQPNRARIIFYTFNDINASSLLRPNTEDIIFPRGSIVVIKKFGLNEDFADFLQALAIETQWKGGLVYEASASLPTNITNGALGFYSTCAVLTDTLIAQ